MLGKLPPIASPDAPPPPGWFPLPPGWWVVATLLFMLTVLVVHFVRRRHLIAWRRSPAPQPAIRMLALAALDELAAREPMSDRQMAYRLNEILRASLFGCGSADDWSSFSPCQDVVPAEGEWQAFWEELAMRYRQPDGSSDRERQQRWLGVARGWIEQLPEETSEDRP